MNIIDIIVGILIGLLLTVILVTSSCDPTATNLSGRYPVMPKGFEDCVVGEACSGQGSCIKMVRCLKSTTTSTYQSGKTTTSVTVDSP
jgi:hypothetical protein